MKKKICKNCGHCGWSDRDSRFICWLHGYPTFPDSTCDDFSLYRGAKK